MTRQPGEGGWFSTMFSRTGGEAGRVQGGSGCGGHASAFAVGVAAAGLAVAHAIGWIR